MFTNVLLVRGTSVAYSKFTRCGFLSFRCGVKAALTLSFVATSAFLKKLLVGGKEELGSGGEEMGRVGSLRAPF